MQDMSIRIMKVVEKGGLIRALAHVHVPGIGARARITIRFRKVPGTEPPDWHEQVYDRALAMLDPA